ncbi:hypothetical protein BDV96DRAFT_507316 [Lophiotrema nucula]|uniref:Aerobic respiration control sensor protein arcB n=1 Tax=Lophiotrema nucula TaxID=690887 RepID=A0A6A5YJC8_9PLEO|nr:hypothetical protein BDV96DRAFT_507316 [Lophiotrema nucula]
MPLPGEGSPQERRYSRAVGSLQEELAVRTIPELKKASSRAELDAITLLDVLGLDRRPTFILDVSLPPASDDAPLEPIYVNPSLADAKELLGILTGTGHSHDKFANNVQPTSRFKSWLRKPASDPDGALKGSAYMFDGFVWSTTTFDHYLLVSGLQLSIGRTEPPGSAQSQPQLSLSIDPREHNQPKNYPQIPRAPAHPPETPVEQLPRLSPAPVSAAHGRFDITLDPPPASLSDHVRYFRSIDWSTTPLGPMSAWQPQLRSLINMIMNDNNPAVLFWGDEVTMIYNESYVEIIALLHPCMGASARVAAKEYWVHFQPIVDHINATGQTWTEHDLPLFVDRHGFLEETYFSFQFVPVLGTEGQLAGYLQPLVETTKNNILERRVSSLVEIGSQTAKARDLDTYWDLVLNTLIINEKDVPFALLYSTEYQEVAGTSSISSPGSAFELELCTLRNRGSIAVSANHPIAPSTIALRSSTYVFIPYLTQAAKSRKPVYLPFDELKMPDGILDDIDWKGYHDPCRSVVICPVLPTTGEQVQGFIILGVNPRRPFDDDYQQFIHVMSRLLATSLASVVLFDEEMRQKENAIGQAARIQEQLLAELKLTEKKFQRFAERADVGIFITNPTGKYTYRNDAWFEIFKDAADSDDLAGAWGNLVFPEDVPFCETLFTKLIIEKTAVCFELRTRMRWTPPKDPDAEGHTSEHFVWILCSAYPELGASDELKEIVGNVTDISKLKWAEDVQKMRVKSALESQRQLENFIDTTSHEMRNPLSAIMQCADGIISSYATPDGHIEVPSPISYSNLLEQTIDAAQTISQCALHMKRIVDDILTISKLDSGLLIITPIDAQPESVANHAVKMFESEAKAAGVDLKFAVDQSFRELGVDWVSLDPTRMLQVLINLITNAVKFTRLEKTRMVTVSVAATTEEPSSEAGGIQYILPKLAEDDSHLQEDWNRGPTLYIRFSVSDTGRGLSVDEKANLFARFSQASPRTHIHYGGSGLGLFISRRLTEMQGGAIGLESEYKRGSTFSFYIRARRTSSALLRRSSMPRVFPEDVRHRPHTPKEIDRLLNPDRPAPVVRRPTAEQAIHSDIPAEALGHSAESMFAELKRTKSIPDTLHVLVVEDNLVNQKVLAKQLRNLGCVVNVANHGAEALEFLKKTRYWDHSAIEPPAALSNASSLPFELSLILMDWEMPVMNGLTAVTKIREFQRDKLLKAHIPVIGVTANVREQQIKTAMEAGMDDVVGKPFRVTELLGRMRGVVAGIAEERLERVREQDS